ncbi:hypothetical protein L6274_04170 [Candidatus Parcubacteria bacterium]|nr:hypothetical protein [Candidatus Parcubacteria bacterium]MCG2809275.1 hypothetical protein [Candidatus Portnoybacteria bacterium]
MIELRECITTLPISPTSRSSIGLAVTPFLMDAFGKKLGKKTILSLNANGAKFYNQNAEKQISGYLLSLDTLGVIPNFIWRDDQEENVSWINLFFNQLQERGYISQEMASVIKCECGAVESLAEAENISPSRTLCFVDKGKRYCRLCNTEARGSRELVYLFNFPASIGLKKIFPSFYTKEIEAMILKFKDYKFLISRSRSSALSLWTGEGNIFLDVDFVWQMFLPILRRYGHEPTILIGGNKNLMACCFSVGTHGCYQLGLILNKAKCLSGRNMLLDLGIPSEENIRQSLVQKIIQYTWWARRMFVESNRERSLESNYQINSRLIKMIKGLLYLSERFDIHSKAEKAINRFIKKYSDMLSEEEISVVTGLVEKLSIGRNSANMSEEYFSLRISVINKIHKETIKLFYVL